jgi:hypothetical protein
MALAASKAVIVNERHGMHRRWHSCQRTPAKHGLAIITNRSPMIRMRALIMLSTTMAQLLKNKIALGKTELVKRGTSAWVFKFWIWRMSCWSQRCISFSNCSP